jgi:hypothetical protein
MMKEKVPPQPTVMRNELNDLFEPLSGNAKNIAPTDPRRRINRFEKHDPAASRDRDTLD